MKPILPSEPGTYGQLIKRSFTLYRKSFTHILLLSFLLTVAIFIPRLLSDIIGQDIFLQVPPLSPHRLWLFAINLVSLIFFVGILWRMHCVNRGLHEPIAQDLYVGITKLVSIVAATILETLIIFAMTLMMYGLFVLQELGRAAFQSR